MNAAALPLSRSITQRCCCCCRILRRSCCCCDAAAAAPVAVCEPTPTRGCGALGRDGADDDGAAAGAPAPACACQLPPAPSAAPLRATSAAPLAAAPPLLLCSERVIQRAIRLCCARTPLDLQVRPKGGKGAASHAGRVHVWCHTCVRQAGVCPHPFFNGCGQGAAAVRVDGCLAVVTGHVAIMRWCGRLLRYGWGAPRGVHAAGVNTGGVYICCGTHGMRPVV
eukprot:366361-Chlamydomonas_euryale.AAC.5